MVLPCDHGVQRSAYGSVNTLPGPHSELRKRAWSVDAHMQVWAVPTTMMQCNWLGERVATVDVSRAISNVINSKVLARSSM